MLKSGYIVLNDYDRIRISDKEVGEKVRLSLMQHINQVIESSIVPEKATVKNNVTIYFEDRDRTKYTVFICTVNHLVNRNKIFMKQNSMILPFNKDMDKYGTVYLSVSADTTTTKIQTVINGFIEEFINRLNASSCVDTFKFVPVIKEELRYEASRQ